MTTEQEQGPTLPTAFAATRYDAVGRETFVPSIHIGETDSGFMICLDGDQIFDDEIAAQAEADRLLTMFRELITPPAAA